AAPPVILCDLQGSFLRTERHALVRGAAAREGHRLAAGPYRRRLWSTQDESLARGEQEHRRPLQSIGGPTRQGFTRRTRGFFPRRRRRSSSTKNGPSWARKKSTVTPTTRMTPSRETTGIMWRLTQSIGWWSLLFPAKEPRKTFAC